MSQNKLPRHIALIMDGNGRWASQKHLPRIAGHKAGAKTVQRTIEHARTLGIEFLTLYAFSTENWNRPKEEVQALFKLLEQTLISYTKEALQKNIRLWVSGSQEQLPVSVRTQIEKAVHSTRQNTGLTVNLALNYGARQEIVHAVNQLVKMGKTNISVQDIADNLYQPGLPDPELIIRTSGEERLSNFLLWQAAYSEFYFTPVLWPDFDEKELDKALQDYQTRKRRFGGL